MLIYKTAEITIKLLVIRYMVSSKKLDVQKKEKEKEKKEKKRKKKEKKEKKKKAKRER